MSAKKKSELGELRRRWKQILNAGGFSHVGSQGRLVAMYVMMYADWSKADVTMSAKRVADRLQVRKSTAHRGIRELVAAGIIAKVGEVGGRGTYVIAKDFGSDATVPREGGRVAKPGAYKKRPVRGDAPMSHRPVRGDAPVPYVGTDRPVRGDGSSRTPEPTVPYVGTNRPLQRNTLRPYRGHMTVSSTDIQSIVSRRVSQEVAAGGTALSDGPPSEGDAASGEQGNAT